MGSVDQSPNSRGRTLFKSTVSPGPGNYDITNKLNGPKVKKILIYLISLL